jgi:exodeoxyribonuclease VII, small subunit
MAKTKMTFEESMSRLEEIVAELEKNEKPLDETITLFEEGLALVKSCDEKLKSYENQIDELMKKSGSDSDEN